MNDGSTIYIPLEIRRNILAYLPHSDLRNTRLVSGTYNELAQSLLFKDIYLEYDQHSFAKLASISQHEVLHKHVRTLTYNAACYRGRNILFKGFEISLLSVALRRFSGLKGITYTCKAKNGTWLQRQRHNCHSSFWALIEAARPIAPSLVSFRAFHVSRKNFNQKCQALNEVGGMSFPILQEFSLSTICIGDEEGSHEHPRALTAFLGQTSSSTLRSLEIITLSDSRDRLNAHLLPDLLPKGKDWRALSHISLGGVAITPTWFRNLLRSNADTLHSLELENIDIQPETNAPLGSFPWVDLLQFLGSLKLQEIAIRGRLHSKLEGPNIIEVCGPIFLNEDRTPPMENHLTARIEAYITRGAEFPLKKPARDDGSHEMRNWVRFGDLTWNHSGSITGPPNAINHNEY